MFPIVVQVLNEPADKRQTLPALIFIMIPAGEFTL